MTHRSSAAAAAAAFGAALLLAASAAALADDAKPLSETDKIEALIKSVEGLKDAKFVRTAARRRQGRRRAHAAEVEGRPRPDHDGAGLHPPGRVNLVAIGQAVPDPLQGRQGSLEPQVPDGEAGRDGE